MLDTVKAWQAVRDREMSSDERFVYGVLTTKVFCRPGCPSRLPRRENVRFYETAEAAHADGLRACLRCKPLEARTDRDRAKIREVCGFIRHHLDDQDALKLAALSRRLDLSSFHFQRLFKSIIGVTPRQYVEALRMETLKQNLKAGATVTDAIYSAGFNSSSRVYTGAGSWLGMTPKEYRAGGKNIAISYATVETPLGLVMLGATDRGLCFLEFGTSREGLLLALEEEYPASVRIPLALPYSEQFTGWLKSLCGFLGGEQAMQPAGIALHGTAFQIKVWTYLQTIPAGSVQTYTDVAAAVGHPKAVRAVASACAANRIAVVVPCHRVIRGDGGLGGYRWGLDRKQALLDAEKRRTPPKS